jgi:hypothetical protein
MSPSVPFQGSVPPNRRDWEWKKSSFGGKMFNEAGNRMKSPHGATF